MGAKINVGLIGAGRHGRLHAENLSHHAPGARLAAVTDINPAAAKACAAEYGIRTVAGNHRYILEDAEIEAVLICSSTDTHSRLIEESAAAGKHIFCEKPIDFYLTRIDRALDNVQRAGVKLQIGFQRRYDPNFVKLRSLVQEELPLFFFVERYREAFVLEMRDFIRCILEDKTPGVTGLDGRTPVVIGRAAKKSLAQNRPVKIDQQ